jgi:hypothetical protein
LDSRFAVSEIHARSRKAAALLECAGRHTHPYPENNVLDIHADLSDLI